MAEPKTRGEMIMMLAASIVVILFVLYFVVRIPTYFYPESIGEHILLSKQITPTPGLKITPVAQDPSDPIIGQYEAKGMDGRRLLLNVYADGTCLSLIKDSNTEFEYVNGISSWRKVKDHYEAFTDRDYVSGPIFMQLTPDGVGFPDTGLSQYYYDKNNALFWPVNFTRKSSG